MPAVAVVIPTLNRSEHVVNALADLRATLPDDAEVVVVDQSAPVHGDHTAAYVASLGDPRIRHLRAPPRGLPAARNLGLASTRAPIVIFLDDDVRVLPGLVAAHVACFDDPRVGGTVGRIVERVVRPNARPTTNHVGLDGRVRTNLLGFEPCEVGAMKGANMAIRRSALARVGGFDENYLGNALLEDADVAARLRRVGFKIAFVPRAEVLHLSAEDGGVRQVDPLTTERWRFHNTGYYVRRHRGLLGAPPLWMSFTAIALERAAQWRRPDAASSLLVALGEGWALAAGPPATAGWSP